MHVCTWLIITVIVAASAVCVAVTNIVIHVVQRIAAEFTRWLRGKEEV